MKHIESIQPEYAADDMTALLLSDATASAALSRLLHDWTGCAIPQAADLPQSEVEELVPLCLSILRRHWQTPLTALGDGTTPMSLADLLRQTIGDRVQGNEAWAIPPANANIPTAVAALRDRKIGGLPEATDGLSFVRILCDSTLSFTELIDDNVGWVCDKENCVLTAMRISKALEKVTLNCVEITKSLFNVTNYAEMPDRSLVLRLPYCKVIGTPFFYQGYQASGGTNNLAYSEVHLDALEETNITGNGEGLCKPTKLYIPNYKRGVFRFSGSGSYENKTTKYFYCGCRGNKTDTIIITDYLYGGSYNALEDFEISEGACQNITLSGPFNSLTEENIYNHILCRLKQDEPMCGEGVTITLGTTNIDKIEAVEEYNLKLTELTDIYGYTFA